jgi:hypothetical protein
MLGDYTKTAWVAGDVISAVKLNNNEDKTAELDTAALQAQGFHSDLAAWYGSNVVQPLTEADTWVNNGWNGAAGTYSADSVNFKTGTFAAKATTPGAIGYEGIHVVKNIDFTKFSDGSVADDTHYIKWAWYIADLTNFPAGGIFIIFHCDNAPTITNMFYYTVAKASLVVGWNYFAIAKSTLSTAGTPAWDTIKGIAIGLTAAGTGACVWTIDILSIQMVRKDPSSAVPNPFQYLSSGTATRRAQITAGEWFVGMENSSLICRNLLAANDDDMLIFTKGFNADFTIHAVMQIKNASDSDNIGFRIDASNRINAYISSDVLYLGSTIAGATTANSTAMAISSGDIVEFEIVKAGTSVTLKAYLNYNRNTVYTPAPASFTPTGTGYLTVGYVSTIESTSNIYSLSIGSIGHAHTADYADVAETLTAGGASALFPPFTGSEPLSDEITASGTLTKTFPLDSANYKHGEVVLETGRYGIHVNITDVNTESFVQGVSLSAGTDLFGSAWSRNTKGYITGEHSTGLYTHGYLATGTYAISINECYINGSNLQLDFVNNSTSSDSLSCDINWRVW